MPFLVPKLRQRRRGLRDLGVAQRPQRRHEARHGVNGDGNGGRQQGLLLEEETHPTTLWSIPL